MFNVLSKQPVRNDEKCAIMQISAILLVWILKFYFRNNSFGFRSIENFERLNWIYAIGINLNKKRCDWKIMKEHKIHSRWMILNWIRQLFIPVSWLNSGFFHDHFNSSFLFHFNTFAPRSFLIGCRSSETEVTALDVQTIEVPSPGHFSFGFDS